MVWMEKTKHKLSGDDKATIMKKGDKKAIIYVDDNEYHEMNDYAISRYKAFLYIWLDKGKSFINGLESLGNVKAYHKRKALRLDGVRCT